MKKKILAFGIILCMLFGLLAVPAGAETEGYYTYTVSNGEATITWVDTSIRGEIIIPSTLGGYPVTSIRSDLFEYYPNIISINVDSNNDNYSSQDGVLFNKEKTALIRCPVGKTGIYTIPDSVTSIGLDAFGMCHLTSITIPDSVTSIGDYAFEFCLSLTSITIPDSVTSIGNGAFELCESLASITISDSVTSIGDYAFYMCYSLTSITIPDSVTSIGTGAFGGRSGLTDVYYGGTEEDWNNISIGSSNTYLTNATRHYTNSLKEPLNYSGETLTILENSVLDIGEDLYFRNGYVNATNGYIKSGDKKITGERINFTNEGKMRLDAGYTAKVEKDNGDGTTDQGFMVGMTNPHGVVTMILGITGTANEVDYTGKTISKNFDFTDYEVSGLVNFGFTVTNIPKPLALNIQSIE